ncbi:MAG: hypothetical protein RL543_445, partial [Pseudomonadota bacterium]
VSSMISPVSNGREGGHTTDSEEFPDLDGGGFGFG